MAMEWIPLQPPSQKGSVSVEEALSKRRSVRSYRPSPLNLKEVSQLLWAAQGVTRQGGGRTAPSAGALYPLELYLIAGDVEGLSPGAYRYSPTHHALAVHVSRDLREELCRAALGQGCVARGAVVLVFCAVYHRVTRYYGERGYRYVLMEVGHAAQNVHLQAVSLKMGTVVIGAFYDGQIKDILGLAGEEEPLYLMPVGRI